MREEHLDFLAPPRGDLVECGGRAAARKVAHHLVFPALEAARVAVGAAFCFQGASSQDFAALVPVAGVVYTQLRQC